MYRFKLEDAERFAFEHSIKTIKRGRELRFRVCPYCRQNTDDKNTFAINMDTGQFKCLRESCNAHGNMITLARDFDFSLGADADEYYNSRKRYRDLRKYPRPEVRTPAVEYLESRGISRKTVERYSITSQKEHDNIIVFPFFDENGEMQFVKYRKADFDKEHDKNKEWCERDCKPILFGMDQCDLEIRTLILTEGQIDSLSVSDCGIANAVSVPTGANGFTWVPYCWDFLNKFDTLIVFGDYEKGHITLLEEMRKRFNGTVKHVRPEDYKDCKDANDILRKYGKDAVIQAINQAVPVQDEQIVDASTVERKSEVDEVIDTGISQLNRLTGGFPLGRLVIITGETGKGKSTLATQFVVRAADQGYKAFIYSGELGNWEVVRFIDRQVAGADCLQKMETELGFCRYEVKEPYRQAVRDWDKNKIFLYSNAIIEGKEDEETAITRTMQNAIRQYGCRVLLIDNLMSAMVDNVALDLYRQQTKFIGMLHNIANSMKVLIILVAHLRKSQGGNAGNNDIAGSSNIANLADITLNYSDPEPRKKNQKNEETHKVEQVEYFDRERDGDRVLHVMKNRITGITGKAKLWYEPASTRISEKRGWFGWEMSWKSGSDGFIPVENAPDDYTEIPF